MECGVRPGVGYATPSCGDSGSDIGTPPASGEGGGGTAENSQARPPVEADDPNYIFRGDARYVKGNPVGVVLDVESEPAGQEFINHVFPKKGRATRFVSFSRTFKSAAGFTKGGTGARGRIFRVPFKALRQLEQEGKLRIYNADQVARRVSQDPDPNVSRQGNNVKRIMQNNQEILIEGQIPAGLITRATR